MKTQEWGYFSALDPYSTQILRHVYINPVQTVCVASFIIARSPNVIIQLGEIGVGDDQAYKR